MNSIFFLRDAFRYIYKVLYHRTLPFVITLYKSRWEDNCRVEPVSKQFHIETLQNFLYFSIFAVNYGANFSSYLKLGYPEVEYAYGNLLIFVILQKN
jgi:hypothetical protein